MIKINLTKCHFALLVIAIMLIAISVYGAVLSFSASILIGIGVIIVEPLPLVFGICGLVGYNIPEMLQQWLSIPF